MARRSFAAVFGRVLKQRRDDLGLSQEALAERADVHRTYVGLIERGKRSPSIDVAKALAEGLENTLAELAGEAERRTR